MKDLRLTSPKIYVGIKYFLLGLIILIFILAFLIGVNAQNEFAWITDTSVGNNETNAHIGIVDFPFRVVLAGAGEEDRDSGSIVENPFVEEIVEGKLKIPTEKLKDIYEFIKERFRAFIGTAIGFIIMLIVTSFLLMVHFKEIIIVDRHRKKTLNYKEKLVYYFAHPFRILDDSRRIVHNDPEKEFDWKETFK